MENLDPPPTKSKVGKYVFFPLHVALSLIWGEGGGGGGDGSSFYSLQDGTL